jgi:hypothetical protein
MANVNPKHEAVAFLKTAAKQQGVSLIDVCEEKARSDSPADKGKIIVYAKDSSGRIVVDEKGRRIEAFYRACGEEGNPLVT